MNCVEEDEEDEDPDGGVGGTEIVGAEVPAGGANASAETGGRVGGAAVDFAGTHATVSGTADGVEDTGAGEESGGGEEIGGGAGAGDSAAARSRTPHFSQNFETAAFCAPHSSQN